MPITEDEERYNAELAKSRRERRQVRFFFFGIFVFFIVMTGVLLIFGR